MSASQLASAHEAAMMRELAAGMRHELRNRLGVVRNAVAYLRGRTQGSELWQADARIAPFFALIESEIGAAADVLSRSALEPAGSTELERVVLNECVALAIEHARLPQGARVSLLACADRDCVLQGDRVQLALAVRCLLENAAETAGGAPVEVRVTKSAEQVVVEIRDRGPALGVGTFSDFARPGFTTKQGHRGIGVNVAERIATQHGGGLRHEPRDPGVAALLWFPSASELVPP